MEFLKDKFHWKYPNITLVLLSVLITIYFLKTSKFDEVISHFNGYGYLGIFISGLFFVSTFTVVPAAAILFSFAHTYDPLLIAIIGGLGSTLGDVIGFLFVRDRLIAELNPFLKALHLYRHVNIVNSKYFGWFAPVLGAAIIASPFPDEVGLTLLGMTKVKLETLLPVAFLLNSIGIFLLAVAA